MLPVVAPEAQRGDFGASPPVTGLGSNRQIAQTIPAAFLFRFVTARLLAPLLMARKIPDLFLYLDGTFVHHLNCGTVLPAAVGGYLVFSPAPNRRVVCRVYRVRIGLAFDAFGMWLRLGASYWRRASRDALAVIAAGLGRFAYGPALAQYRPQHWLTATLIPAPIPGFFHWLAESVLRAEGIMLPGLARIEQAGPP